MRICTYEDRHVQGLEPLTLTRPAADLLCGLTALGEKQTRYFAATGSGHLCRAVMADQIRSRDPGACVNIPSWLRAAPAILVNARWVPPAVSSADFEIPFTDVPYLGIADGGVAFAVLDTKLLSAVTPATIDVCLADWMQSLPTREVGGTLIGRPWELINLNADQIIRDFEAGVDPGAAGFHPIGFALLGPAERLLIHPSAQIDPMVVADTTHGPVIIGAGAVIHAFTRLEGPCAIGAGTVLLGATVRAGTTFGPQCRIGGEVECSIVQGYSNKSHEGFLGHSYLGEWVNLAAGTHTSDLRCDYRPVSVRVDGHEIPTGRTKIGSVIGDHAKTGLGVLLDCGSTIGPFAQVLPTGGLASRSIPAFTRSGPSGMKALTDVDRLLDTADVVMRRRGKELTPALETIYRAITHQPPAAQMLPLRRTA